MNFKSFFGRSETILMEGAIGERLKREYNFTPDEHVALAAMIYHPASREALERIYREYISIATRYGIPFIATTPTRRANRERVSLSVYNESIIADNVRFLEGLKKYAGTEMYIGGLMGCKGDAYMATDVLPEKEALEFHSWQADLFKAAGADFLFAGIMPALTEARGMAKAMEATALPYIISFMLKKDGKLPDGTTLNDAISGIEQAVSEKPLCYMTNCVHPLVLAEALAMPFNSTSLVRERFMGIQANTSTLAPEELDNCNELITTRSTDLAGDMMDLSRIMYPKIMGGCCGTDGTHMEELAKRLQALAG